MSSEAVPTSAPPTPDTAPRTVVLCAVVAMVLTALFLAPWWNRYVGVSLSGYFPLYGRLITQGLVPYRDFFLHLPPLQALANAALETLVGPSLLAVNLMGAVGRILCAGVLAVWMARRFSPATAVGAALAAVWIGSGDDTEILDFYNYHALLACIASALFASIAWSRAERATRWWLLCGFAAGIAIWTKQTVGLAATLAVPVVLGITSLRDGAERSRLFGRMVLFAAGWAVPAVLLGGWLWSEGALGAFLQQTFTDAAASKGSPSELPARAWLHPFQIPTLIPSAWVGVAMTLAMAVLVATPASRVGAGSSRRLWITAVTAVLVLSVGWGLVLFSGLGLGRWVFIEHLKLLQMAVVFFAHYGGLTLALLLALRAARRVLPAPDRDLLLMTVSGAACSASLALSYPGGLVLALPALAPVLAWIGDGRGRVRQAVLFRVLASVGVAAAVVAGISVQSVVPFDFAQWCEPPLMQSTARSELPELRGMRMSIATRDALDRTTRLVRAVSEEDEPILVVPVAALFYWLAGRNPATFAAVHWFDVTPDRIVLTDGALIRTRPPPVIIRQWLTGPYTKIHENYFRNGEVSELRMLNEYINGLLGLRYMHAMSFTGCHNAPAYQVWVRNDRVSLIPPL